LQIKYGYSKDKAEQEYNQVMEATQQLVMNVIPIIVLIDGR